MHAPNADQTPAAEQTTIATFLALDIRAGTVRRAEAFPEARKPAIKLWIDFGPAIGLRASSAQITDHYTPQTLIGRRVAAVVNVPPRQIGPFQSDVLTLGFPDATGAIRLTEPHADVPDGARLA